MREESATPDLRASRIAARQHGVLSVRQLHACGFTKDGIARRAVSGRLYRLHRGVYAFGHATASAEERSMAAVLACADCAQGGDLLKSAGQPLPVLLHWGVTISHRSAAVLWELLPATDGPVDVSIPGDSGRKKRRGIRIHRCRSLLPAAVTLRNGIPVTTPARTLADLGRASAACRPGAVAPRELRRAIRQAEVLGLPIGDGVERDRTRSDLERDFLHLCRRHGIAKPEVNVRVGEDLVDFLWRERWLVVETDSYLYHRGRAAFEDDRERDLRLRAAGFDVIRVSEKQLDTEPGRVAEAVAAALRVGPDAHRREDQGEYRAEIG